MRGEYALSLLKNELSEKKGEIVHYQRRDDNKMERTITKMKHQIYDLEFAIELLEEYQD